MWFVYNHVIFICFNTFLGRVKKLINEVIKSVRTYILKFGIHCSEMLYLRFSSIIDFNLLQVQINVGRSNVKGNIGLIGYTAQSWTALLTKQCNIG